MPNPFQPFHLPNTATHKNPRRAVAWLLLVVFFVTFLPLDSGELPGLATAEADPLAPRINSITIEKTRTATGQNLFRVVFNGFQVQRITNLSVLNAAGTIVYEDIDPSAFTIQGTTTMISNNIDDLQDIFGTSNRDIRFNIYYDGGINEHPVVFNLPADNLPNIAEIYDGNAYVESPGWPATVRNETGVTMRLKGSNLTTGYTLRFLYPGSSPYTFDSYDVINNEIYIPMDSATIPGGQNVGIRMERLYSPAPVYADVAGIVRFEYTLNNSLNIITPLELGTVEISPLRGTRGTLVRIRAGVGSDNVDFSNNLVAPGVTVRIGTVEAVRNEVEELAFSGVFQYVENGIVKQGLEVVVPQLETTGNKAIVIESFSGDTYSHGQTFFYEEAVADPLRVMSVTPDNGPVGTRNRINPIVINNLASLDRFAAYSAATAVRVEQGTSENLLYPEFLADANDEGSLFFRYTVGTGDNITYVEKRVNMVIGQVVEELGTNWPQPGQAFEGTIQELRRTTDLNARTAPVGEAGEFPVRVRTESVRYRIEGEGEAAQLVVLDSIAEQTPVVPADAVYYEFISVDEVPVITQITPDRGPYDKNILATLTGSNLLVQYRDGERFLPTVIIGTEDDRYKVINRQGVYLTDNASGVIDEEPNLLDDYDLEDPETPYRPLEVLDNAGNIVDGRVITTGTQIKLTIPGDLQLPLYSGPAEVYVRNPTPEGLPGIFSAAILFQYLERTGPQLNLAEVDPSRVGTTSQESVLVTGSPFENDMLLTIDGALVPDLQVNPAGGTIQFNAPVGRAGLTWLQLINPATGALASHRFEYVRSDSQPTIASITPDSGGQGTLVIIKGTNFFRPDPEGETEASRRGTIVRLEGKDVNLFYHDETQFFTDPFDNSPDPEPILGPDGEPIPTYGSHVTVVDNQTIYMIVPDPVNNPGHTFTRDTPLNVEVINPDLGKATRAGGFRILDILDSQRPRIEAVVPNLGDYRGGNIVEIRGERIRDNASVYFGSQQATVFRRSTTGNWIRVFVPAYAGTLTADQAVVPVTVQNTDSSSFTLYNGYTYVNPGYPFMIQRITPNAGNTAGGDRVVLEGQSFRVRVDAEAGEVEYPSVYFGGIQVDPAHISFPNLNTEVSGVFSSEALVVEQTPSNLAGATDVTAINFDGATANLRNGFTYRLRQVGITNILPNTGNVNGGDQITITGRDFVERGLHVVFGNETTTSDTVSTITDLQLGDVIIRFVGDEITFYYKNTAAGSTMEVYAQGENTDDEDEITEGSTFTLADDSTRFFTIPWSQVAGPDDTDKALWADEGIKVSLVDNRLTFTRRLGQVLSVEGETRIRVVTPPYFQTGPVNLTVYNSDGVNASGDFTYTSPFRPPVITNIIPVIEGFEVPATGQIIDLATAAPQGGSPLVIQGRNFRAGVEVYIDSLQAPIASRALNDDELIITVPPAPAGGVGQYFRILVLNQDGGFTYADVVPEDQTRNPYYFRYTPEGSNPVITTVNPDRGPVTGGTKVTISGTDFRGEDAAGNPRDVQVFLGGFPVPQSNVTFVDDRTLEVTVPEGRVGPQTVEVLNHDFGRALAPMMYTYVSQPNIATTDPARIFANDANADVTVTGEMFQNGARVILGGRLVPAGSEPAGETNHGTGIRGVTGDGVNQQYSIVGGIAAATVNVTNEGFMILRFPEALDLPNNDLIILNPDDGLSDPYADFDYAIPIPDAPLVLEAVPGAEGSVQLIWSKSAPEVLNAADRFEVYGKRSNENQYTYIGEGEDAQHLVRGLLLDTRYDFMVRALNRYGSAIEFAEVSTRTLSARQDPKLGEKIDELDRQQAALDTQGKEEVVGNRVIRTVGSREIPAGTTPYVLDFSTANYSRQNDFVVAFPVAALSNMTRPVRITDGRGSLTITPSHLLTREVSSLTATQRRDAVVEVNFKRVEGTEATGLVSAVTRTQSRASAPYSVAFSLQAGRTSQNLARLLGNAAITINQDTGLYPNATNTSLMVYDPSSHRFNSVGSIATFRDPGTYMLLGTR